MFRATHFSDKAKWTDDENAFAHEIFAWIWIYSYTVLAEGVAVKMR